MERIKNNTNAGIISNYLGICHALMGIPANLIIKRSLNKLSSIHRRKRGDVSEHTIDLMLGEKPDVDTSLLVLKYLVCLRLSVLAKTFHTLTKWRIMDFFFGPVDAGCLWIAVVM